MIQSTLEKSVVFSARSLKKLPKLNTISIRNGHFSDNSVIELSFNLSYISSLDVSYSKGLSKLSLTSLVDACTTLERVKFLNLGGLGFRADPEGLPEWIIGVNSDD